MKKFFYPTFAVSGIKKNKQLYLPYILTCMGMIMMFYIISFLSHSEAVLNLRGGDTIGAVLEFGSVVMGVFSLIFLFYTNSFLVRRRKKEFGLYNILGMNKRNIASILVWETLIIFSVSFIGGTILGIALSKLVELGIVDAMQGTVSYPLTVSVKSIVDAFILFGIISVLILINTLRQIHISNPIALLHSDNVGEKPPKANWFLGIAGIAVLAVAYYFAVTIDNPIEALELFFLAVIMVIAGTYLLFIAGSVLICRLLQRNKKYYYKANHFVSVSSMAYRMKRNGAGLASICIFATMVLVMMASTTCLFIGTEDSLKKRHPTDMRFIVNFETAGDMNASNMAAMKRSIEDNLSELNEEKYNEFEYYLSDIFGQINGNVVNPMVNEYMGGKMVSVHIMPLNAYNNMLGINEECNEGEAIICTNKYKDMGDTFSIEGGKTVKIKKVSDVPEKLIDSNSVAMGVGIIVVVVPDLPDYVKPLEELGYAEERKVVSNTWYYGFDMKSSDERQIEVYPDILENFGKIYKEGNPYNISSYQLHSLAESRSSYYASNASLFILGILLSVVFVFAAVLIIYYKQVSEGYEDQARFEIMQKVGMTKKEIKKSINSQILTVFFMPLITAGVHLSFAFPFIRQLLVLFGVLNTKVLIITTIISFLIFALFYVIVYKITSNVYYSIVSGANK